jgi:hypothetical protein
VWVYTGFVDEGLSLPKKQGKRGKETLQSEQENIEQILK